MPVLSVPTGGIGVTIDPILGVPIADTFSVTEYGTGWAKLVADGSNGDLLKRLLQGNIVVDSTGVAVQDPSAFGGLTPDNTANGYTTPTYGQYAVSTNMPNSNAPLVNYIVCSGVFIAEVLQVIDDNTMIVKDSGVVAAFGISSTIFGLSTNSYPLTSAQIITTATSDGFLFLPGQAAITITTNQTITFSPNNYGAIEPFMFQGTNGNTTMIYNE
jgi:hypothetical protein